MNPLDDPVAIRSADRDLLSLALLDARNHLLKAWAGFDGLPVGELRQAAASNYVVRLQSWQSQWLLTESESESTSPQADEAGEFKPVDYVSPRGRMAQMLELALERMADLTDEPRALALLQQAVLLEDRLAETLTVLLQQSAPPARSQRPALWLPAQRVALGCQAGDTAAPGVPCNEWGGELVAVPEFEIDAQAVNWSQYAEFALDGGYDRPELWGDAGWAWLQAMPEPCRAPRHVQQFAGGVMVQRGYGKGAVLQRAAAGQPALHITRHEAQAWCRWAGRRLPTEPEWELAASTAASRGFVWGDVFEWVAGSARSYPGAAVAPDYYLDRPPPAGSQGVLRGASFATRLRRHHPKARRFMAPGHDLAFCGFRSCAV